MIVVPANPNSVHVGMVRTGCLKIQFSSTYPTRLNGIISQHEFRESISNINSKIFSNKSQIFCIVFFVLCIIGGLALVIAGAVSQTYSRASPTTILFAVGVTAIIFAPFAFSIGWCVIRTRRTTKMRQAIAEESKKYSTRSPTACGWRLSVTRIWTGGYRHHHRTLFLYHVIIDIRRPAISSANTRLHPKQVPSRPTSTVRPQDDILPPPYPGHPATFCSQCGIPKPDPTAKFCSSCGHSFDKY